MSAVKQRIIQLKEIKKIMIDNCITIEEIRRYWFVIDHLEDDLNGQP